MRARGCAAIALVVGSLAGRDASGDAVPPRPESCPLGQVGITDHQGPRCVPRAPTDCPPGWTGAVGGRCVLRVCTGDADCGDGARCVPHRLCFDQVMCHPRSCGTNPPTFYSVPVRPCGAGAPRCESPSECKPGKLCLPEGVATADPTGGGKAAGGAGSTPAGGCAGCGGQRAAAAMSLPLLIGLAFLAFGRRRGGPGET